MPSEIYLTSGPIWAITYVKQQKIFNGEHLERRESHVRCMALLEAIDKPPLPIPTAATTTGRLQC